MRHGLALLLKVSMTMTVYYIMLTSLNYYPLFPTLLLAVLTTAIAYLIGDLFIYPLSNNLTASLADLGLSIGVIWIIGPFLLGEYVPLNVAIWTSLLLAVGELIFHIYMANFVFEDEPVQPVS